MFKIFWISDNISVNCLQFSRLAVINTQQKYVSNEDNHFGIGLMCANILEIIMKA